MAADLNRPILVIPSGTANGAVFDGATSPTTVHTLISGTEWIDAVTIEAWNTTAAALTAGVSWPNTGGSATTVKRTLGAAGETVVVVIDRWTGNGGGAITVTSLNATGAAGALGVSFKVSVERYPAGKNEPDPARK